MNSKILIAKISSAHGIKGEVKLSVYSNNPAKIEKYDLSDESGNEIKVAITSKKNLKTPKVNLDGSVTITARINEIADRNLAEGLKNLEIFVSRANLEKNKENEFYYSDLVGLKLIDETTKKEIGKITHIFDFGIAGQSVEMEFLPDSIPNGMQKIFTLPFKDRFFPNIDQKSGIAIVRIPVFIDDEIKDLD